MMNEKYEKDSTNAQEELVFRHTKMIKNLKRSTDLTNLSFALLLLVPFLWDIDTILFASSINLWGRRMTVFHSHHYQLRVI